ncbi:MAG: dihydrolipoyl dehydrogenase family protein [Candidatus Dependentiae bacterium]
MKKYDYDIAIIGGGAAGLVASKFAAGMGKKVILFEKNKLGGECTNTGCIPSKTILRCAQAAHEIMHAEKYGLPKKPLSIDSSLIMDLVKKTITEVANNHTPESLEKLGITVLFEAPQFLDNHTLQTNNRNITAAKIIIVTGSRPAIPSISGIEKVPYLTNQTLFQPTTLPQSLIILGAGPVGVEMACALTRLGVKVYLIEQHAHILPQEEPELAKIVHDQLVADGATILVNATAKEVSQQDNIIKLQCRLHFGTTIIIQAEQLLVATGRVPNIENLHLEAASIEYQKSGILVNNKLQTTTKNIYAAGDVAGPYLFSHVAEYQAVIATYNACIPLFKKKVDYTNIVWVTFCDPELAHAGLTIAQAKKIYGNSIKIYRRDYLAIDRSFTDQNKKGRAIFICNKKGKLIGAHIAGARAGELIGQVQLGKVYNISFVDFYHVMHAYPAYSDVIWQAAKKAYIERTKANQWIKIAQKIYSWLSR